MPASKSKAKGPVKHWAQRIGQSKAKGMLMGFRSGLEGNNAKHLEALQVPVLYETFAIPYVVPQKAHRYTPDFLLPNGIIVETKGIWDATDRAKHLLVKLQYPELDIRVVFTRGKAPIYPGSATTCAEWADKHGFVWAEKLIPESWVREAGPSVRPEAVLAKGPVGYEAILKMEPRKR